MQLLIRCVADIAVFDVDVFAAADIRDADGNVLGSARARSRQGIKSAAQTIATRRRTDKSARDADP